MKALAHTTTPRSSLPFPSSFLDPCTNHFLRTVAAVAASDKDDRDNNENSISSSSTAGSINSPPSTTTAATGAKTTTQFSSNTSSSSSVATKNKNKIAISQLQGNIYEILTAKQFASEFDSLNRDAGGGPRAFCGAAAPAAALRLAAALGKNSNSSDGHHLASVLAEALHDIRSNFASDVLYLLHKVQRMRQDVHKNNPTFFPTSSAVENFFRNWIANYEVSDVIQEIRDGVEALTAAAATAASKNERDDAREGQQQQQKHEQPTQQQLHPLVRALFAAQSQHQQQSSALWSRVSFFRANQSPELISATPDERVRLLREESSFGGVPLKSATSSKSIEYLHGDASCFLELFGMNHNNVFGKQQKQSQQQQSTRQQQQEQPAQQKQQNQHQQEFVRLLPAGGCRCPEQVKQRDKSSSADAISARDKALNETEGETATSIVRECCAAQRTPTNQVECEGPPRSFDFLLTLPLVTIIDLKGHFLCCVFFMEEQVLQQQQPQQSQQSQQEQNEKKTAVLSMALFNSMEGSVVNNSATTAAYDLVFAMLLMMQQLQVTVKED